MERLQGPGHCPGGPLAPQKASTLDPFKRKKYRKTKRQKNKKTARHKDDYSEGCREVSSQVPQPTPKVSRGPV